MPLRSIWPAEMHLKDFCAAEAKDLDAASGWTVVAPGELDTEIATIEAICGPLPTKLPQPGDEEWAALICGLLAGAHDSGLAVLEACLAASSRETRRAVRLSLAQVREAIREGLKLRSKELDASGLCMVARHAGERYARLLQGELSFVWVVQLDSNGFPVLDVPRRR